ncbi:dual specificity phosphatase [Desarmillaria tabescens]|uniref:Dual specificity phosphatase n=1 Tax=Armillaria tabescens TaxID=1929756 RepID=A0AA39NIV5_ARMTA|nr:dual specificity phosphatase [Desarmillaria tabescens]KAK0466449.1 dual specificity phosphatase [Desarmillaria tabescens]
MDIENTEPELTDSCAGISHGVDANGCNKAKDGDPKNPYLELMEEIVEGKIYLRTVDESMSEVLRQKHRITHVLTLCNAHFLPEQRRDLVLVIRRDRDEDIYSHFYEAVDYIHSVLLRQGKVLIHCMLEISRGIIIVAAYLIHTRNMTVEEALACIRQRREWDVSHGSFLKQLRIYECSHNPSSDNPKYLTWKSKQDNSAVSLKTYLFLDRIYLRGSFLPDEDEAEAKIKAMKVTHLLTTVSQRRISLDSKFHVIDTQRIYQAAQFIHAALEAKGTVLIYYPEESVSWTIICTYLMAYANSKNSETVYATMDAGLVSNAFEGEWKPVEHRPRIVVTGTEYSDATESKTLGRETVKVTNDQESTIGVNKELNHLKDERYQSGSKSEKTKFSKKVKTWFGHGRGGSKSGKEG